MATSFYWMQALLPIIWRVSYQVAINCVVSAMEDNINVRGYFCWSAFDNFEWNSGYRPQFGIIAVDRKTQQRTPKPSAHWLGHIARENRLRLD